MYCKNCGNTINENALYCPYCGAKLDSTQLEKSKSLDIGFFIVGFLIPILGLIVFLLYEKKEPKKAKSAVKGALIGFVAKIALVFLSVLVSFVITFSITNI